MEVKITKYGINPSTLKCGTAGSFGIETLSLSFDSAWDGLSKTAYFYPPRKKPIAVIITSSVINIPHEATEYSGMVPFTVKGVKTVTVGQTTTVEKTIYTVQGMLEVESTKSGVGATAGTVPTPSEIEQIRQYAENAASSAASAEESAEDASESASDAAESAATAQTQAALSADAATEAASSAESASDSASSSASSATAAQNAIIESVSIDANGTMKLTKHDGNVITASGSAKGAKGDKGDTGAKGDTGERGETGATGASGVGISNIAKTGTSGKTDTYTITLTDGSTKTFTVTNGNDGSAGDRGISFYTYVGAIGPSMGGIYYGSEDSVAKPSGVSLQAGDFLVVGHTEAGKLAVGQIIKVNMPRYSGTTFTAYDTGCNIRGADGAGVPSGGTTGQVLKKRSGTDYDTEWADGGGGGGSGTVTSVSVKMNGATKGTVTTSGTIDLGTVVTEHQSLSAYRTSAAQDIIDNGKQNVISDLSTIRSGAAAGATAVQPEAGKGLFSGNYNDLTNKPTIPDVSGKADKVVGAAAGNLAGLDGSGNLTDSGKSETDFAGVTVGDDTPPSSSSTTFPGNIGQLYFKRPAYPYYVTHTPYLCTGKYTSGQTTQYSWKQLPTMTELNARVPYNFGSNWKYLATDDAGWVNAMTNDGTLRAYRDSNHNAVVGVNPDTVALQTDIAGKADKVTPATDGNFAGLDSNGNITDSGKKASDFQTALSSQTAYTSKGSSTKVPQITTNSLGQVTNITEVTISGGGGGGTDANAVHYTADGKGSAEQAQARANIGAGTYSLPGSGIPITDLEEQIGLKGAAYMIPLYAYYNEEGLVESNTYLFTDYYEIYNPTAADEYMIYLGETVTGSYEHGALYKSVRSSVSSSGYRWSKDSLNIYSDATTSSHGLMSSTDKTKLDGVASGATAVDESTVSGWGFTKNAGTITGITMNGSSKGESGVVDLGSVLTSHQSLSAYRTSSAQDIIDNGKADKVANAVADNLACLDENGNLTDSGKKPADFATASSYASLSTTVSGHTLAINGKQNIISDLSLIREGAGLGSTAVQPETGKGLFSGNYNDLTNKPTIPTVPTNVSAFTNDAGYLTSHQSISGKADKVTTATSGNFAGLDGNGNLTDSGKKASDFVERAIKTAMDSVAVAGASYFLGTLTDNLTVTLPTATASDIGKVISVVFYVGATVYTLTVSGTQIGDIPVPAANQRVEMNMMWDGSYWAVVSNVMAVTA